MVSPKMSRSAVSELLSTPNAAHSGCLNGASDFRERRGSGRFVGTAEVIPRETGLGDINCNLPEPDLWAVAGERSSPVSCQFWADLALFERRWETEPSIWFGTSALGSKPSL